MKVVFTPKWMSTLAFLLILLGLYVESTYETTVMIVSLLLPMWFAIALHELGHVVFGKLSGFELVFFTVGPFQIEKTIDRIKLTENKQWMYVGGVAMMTPPIQLKKEILIKKWALFVAGGPAFSLVLGVISFILYEQFSLVFLGYFALMNGAILLTTIIPFKTNMRSDGYVLLTLMKNNNEPRELVDELLSIKELFSRKKPKEWNPETIKLAKQKPASIDNLQYAMVIYYFEIEQNGFQSAINAMTEYSKIPVTKKNKLQLGFLIHMQQLSHFLDDDVQTEQIVHSQQLLTSMEPVSFFRGKAMVAFLQNDRQAALRNLQKVKEMIEQNDALYGFFKAEKTLTKLVEEKISNN